MPRPEGRRPQVHYTRQVPHVCTDHHYHTQVVLETHPDASRCAIAALMAASEDASDVEHGELRTLPASILPDRPRGMPPPPSDMMLRSHPASSCCGRMGGRVLARPVTTNSRFDSPPDEMPLTIAYGDDSERGSGRAARRARRCPTALLANEIPDGPRPRPVHIQTTI
jgi:hypothetical protein